VGLEHAISEPSQLSEVLPAHESERDKLLQLVVGVRGTRAVAVGVRGTCAATGGPRAVESGVDRRHAHVRTREPRHESYVRKGWVCRCER